MEEGTIEEIDEKAAYWAARAISGALTHGEKVALDDWLAGSEDRRRAYKTYMDLAELTAGADDGPAERLLEQDLTEFAARNDKLYSLDARSGVARYDGAALADVVAEFNRCFDVELVLGDLALADVKVTGEFDASDPARLVRDLCDALALTVENREGGAMALLPKK